MARDISKRLDHLNTRRRGRNVWSQLTETARVEMMSKSATEEQWQKRANNQPYTKYTLGAMQEVDPDYTRISVETADRVKNQLDSGLSAQGYSVGFKLQGSVPLNVHIRGVSDVDLLAFDTSFKTYDRQGLMSLSGAYSGPTSLTSVGVLTSLRNASEDILSSRFPAAKVDKSGGKAISISGASLARSVDVVPAHWHDSTEYQASRQEHDRVVTILNKKVPETLDNLPFRHIHRIHELDRLANGGLKKSIRLCKNVKNDAIEEGKTIEFPSFDIAATMFHCNIETLRNSLFYELAVLAETQRFLDELYHNPAKAMSLWVPDGSRRIFDNEAKYNGLKTLSVEMDDLAREVAKEQSALLMISPEVSLSDARGAILQKVVPGAY